MVILIDYGLSRKHLKSDGNPKPKKKAARWVGSRRYMSINAHLRKDQGRRDDLWSLLYVLVEFITGTLPWAHLKGLHNLDKVRDMKMQFNQDKLVRGLPEEFLKFMNHLHTLNYESIPDYELLHQLFKNLFEKGQSCNHQTPFDWEPPEDAANSPKYVYALSDEGFANIGKKESLDKESSETSAESSSSSGSSLTTQEEDEKEKQTEAPDNNQESTKFPDSGSEGKIKVEKDDDSTTGKKRCVIL